MDDILGLLGSICGYSLRVGIGYRVVFSSNGVVDIYLGDGTELSIHDLGDRLVYFRTDVSVGIVIEKFGSSLEDSVRVRSWLGMLRSKSKSGSVSFKYKG